MAASAVYKSQKVKEKQIINILSGIYRNSHQRYSVQKGVFRNFAKFTGKHL